MHDTPTLDISITTAPTGGITLESELALVKAALLYGDRVSLYSPMASMLCTMASSAALTADEKVAALRSMQRIVQPGSTAAKHVRSRWARYDQAMRKHHKSLQDLVIIREVREIADNAWRDQNEVMQSMVTRGGGEQLAVALGSGLVTVEPLDVLMDADKMISGIVGSAQHSMTSGRSYPLFDEQVGGLVGALIKEGRISVTPTDMARSRHVGLAAALLDDLPLFEASDMSTILDIRRELEKPLIRFRAAVLGYSDSLDSEPWSSEFAQAAQVVYHGSVAPAVLDIQEAIRESSFLRQLWPHILQDKVAVASGSALGIAIAGVGFSSEVASVIGVTTGAAAVLLGSLASQREARRGIERHGMFFYYRAGRRLGEGR